MVTGCSGIEGIGIAAQWAGMEIVGQIEIDEFCNKILEKYWPHVTRMKNMFDVKGDEFGAVDIFAAGFPCQPFSCAGKRKGNADDRYLWPETLRIIRTMQPTWVIVENVDGIGTMEQSDYEIDLAGETTICTEADMVLETIRRDFEDAGYQTLMLEIPACAVNARHRRDRYFIVGYSERARSRRLSIQSGESRQADIDTDRASEIMGNTECSGCNRYNRRRTEQKFADGCIRIEAMADTESAKPQGTGNTWGRFGGFANSSQNVADTDNSETARQREHGGEIHAKSESKGFNMGGSHAADACGTRCEECNSSCQPDRQGHNTGRGDAGGGAWATQSGICRGIDELANRIHRFRQPAFMGQPQYDWEPPRTATGVKNRTNRLKALGNMVDPLQIYPILQVIYWIETGQIEAVRHGL